METWQNVWLLYDNNNSNKIKWIKTLNTKQKIEIERITNRIRSDWVESSDWLDWLIVWTLLKRE